MVFACRLIAFLIGFAFLAGALGFAVTPGMMEADFAVKATRVDGFGTLRADIGGAFAGIACFAFAGMRAGGAHWLRVPLVMVGAMLAVRLVHLGVDGVTPFGIRSTVIEIVLVALLAFAHRVLGRADRA